MTGEPDRNSDRVDPGGEDGQGGRLGCDGQPPLGRDRGLLHRRPLCRPRHRPDQDRRPLQVMPHPSHTPADIHGTYIRYPRGCKFTLSGTSCGEYSLEHRGGTPLHCLSFNHLGPYSALWSCQDLLQFTPAFSKSSGGQEPVEHLCFASSPVSSIHSCDFIFSCSELVLSCAVYVPADLSGWPSTTSC